MRYTTLLFSLFLSAVALGQATFVVDDFSDRYFGKVFIADTTAVFSKGWVAILDKKTKKQLIRINSDELIVDLEEGKIRSNIKELPYGRQSLIIHEDFNFDGKKDLAIMDGQNSCYHGPSFRVYLLTRGGFVRSPAFTRLAQEYCGMFNVDDKAKKIHTMTKSGCCWHQYSDFVVRDNRPVAVRVLEVGMNANGLAWDYVEKKLVGGKMQTRKYSMLDLEDQDKNVFYSFGFSNKKKARLIKNDEYISYVFTDGDGRVELIHSGTFYYSKTEGTLSFTNVGTTYRISKEGILVISPTSKTLMKAEPSTITGSMFELQNNKFENVISR